jgi:hypothetical protein
MPGKLCTSWVVGSTLFAIAACAAGDAPRSGVADPAFDAAWETYRHRAPDFSLRYPYTYHATESAGPGQIFIASDALRVPSIAVSLMPRVEGLALGQSTSAAAKRVSPGAKVISERDTDLGGVPARVATLEWTAPFGLGVELRTMLVSAYVADQWIVVSATDGVTKGPLLPELETAAMSLRFE